jgi:hypothetical protein
VKMQALRNGVKSLRSDVSTPCWVETGEAGRIGAAEGKSCHTFYISKWRMLTESRQIVGSGEVRTAPIATNVNRCR